MGGDKPMTFNPSNMSIMASAVCSPDASALLRDSVPGTVCQLHRQEAQKNLVLAQGGLQ